MNASKIAPFPDTNLFLHYRPLHEIDWCSLLHSSTVEIKIAPVVARELEKQKTLNPTTRRQNQKLALSRKAGSRSTRTDSSEISRHTVSSTFAAGSTSSRTFRITAR